MSEVRRRRFLLGVGALLAAPLGAAKKLGLKVPQSVLLRADRVIE